MKKTTRLLSKLLVGTLLSLGLQQAAQAQTLSYTNTTADAWLTPSSWNPANDWNSGAVKTNATTANVRLNIGSVVNQPVSVTYDATMGITILNNTNLATRGLVIGSGNSTTGVVTIAGGAFVIRNGTQTDSGLHVGSPASGGSAQATLTLSGGNFVYTNANGNANGFMCVPFRGGSTNGGANFARGVFTIGGGSVATIDRIFFGFTASEAGAQGTGILNLNAFGTLSTRNIQARDSDASQMTSFVNFNGGTLHVYGPNTANLGVTFISDSGSNLTLNVQSGGAIIDTAGVNATVGKGLLDAGGGGGLTKNGLATLTLNQTNTYTGATVVNGGGLSFILPMSSSSLTLADGTTASITTRDHSWTNTVTSVTNSTINLALGAVTAIPSATTAVFKTATLNVSGTNVINITSGSGLTPGIVKLIDYTSSGNRSGSGTFVLGTLAPGIQATLIDGPTDVRLNVSLSVQSLTWTASASSDWQTNGLANWNGGVATYLEYVSGVGDVANFVDSPSTFYTVNLTSDVKPALANINITNAAVTFSGAGRIVGANGLTKAGIGILSLANANIYDGVTSVENGTLQVFNGFALGSSVGETVVASTGVLSIGSGVTVSGETARISGPGFGGSRGTLRGADAGDNVWAGPIVLAINNARIGTEDGGKLTVSGPISDGGNNYAVLYRPGSGGTVIAAGSGHAYGGATATFGGTVKLGSSTGFSTNALQVGAGTVDLNGFSSTVGGLFEFVGGGPGVILNNGGAPSTLTFNVADTNILDGTASIQDGSQPISVVKSGGGRQSLTSTTGNTYTGGTVVNGGDLRLHTTLANSAVTVNSGGTLSVGISATVNSTITVNSGGTLSLGVPFVIGVLTNTSTVTLNSGSTCVFHLDAGNTNLNDQLFANNVNYAGTLVVTNVAFTPVTNGQVFKLVTAVTPSGNFANAASVAIYPAGTGTFNPLTGELTVTSVPAPPTLNAVQSGNSLQFSWANLNGVYHLQAQTNSLNVGISTNWSNYSGGNTNSVTVPIDPANGAVFYRLVAP